MDPSNPHNISFERSAVKLVKIGSKLNELSVATTTERPEISEAISSSLTALIAKRTPVVSKKSQRRNTSAIVHCTFGKGKGPKRQLPQLRPRREQNFQEKLFFHFRLITSSLLMVKLDKMSSTHSPQLTMGVFSLPHSLYLSVECF